MLEKFSHIRRDIAAGEVIRHTGPLMVHGSIGAGAVLDVADGGIKVSGNVADGVTLRTRGAGGLGGGIRISGTTGNNVTLDSDLKVTLGTAGDHLRIRAGGGVSMSHVGNGLNLTAGAEVNGGNTGQNAHIRAKGSCVLAQAGDGTIIEAASVLYVTHTGHDCRFSGDAFHAAVLGADAKVRALSSAFIGVAHRSAAIDAPKVQVRDTAQNDKDFRRLKTL